MRRGERRRPFRQCDFKVRLPIDTKLDVGRLMRMPCIDGATQSSANQRPAASYRSARMTSMAPSRGERSSAGIVTEGDARDGAESCQPHLPGGWTRCARLAPGAAARGDRPARTGIVLGAENVVVEQFAFAATACLSAFPLRAALMLLAALLNAAIGPVASMSPRITALGGVAFSGLGDRRAAP